MKKLLLLLSFAIFIISCKKTDGVGPVQNETRNVSGFAEVKSAIADEVTVTPGKPFSLVIEGQQNIIDLLETFVEDNRLIIRFKDGTRLKPGVRIKVRVSAPEIKGLIVSDAGSINVLDTVKTNQLELNVNGSGDLFLSAAVVTTLNAALSGSGNTKISGGSAADLAISLKGSGDADLRGLSAARADIKSSDSGDAWLQVIQHLKVKISGSGDINYLGTPGIDADIKGSGQLRKM